MLTLKMLRRCQIRTATVGHGQRTGWAIYVSMKRQHRALANCLQQTVPTISENNNFSAKSNC